jgi:hypothetical protein
MFSSVYAFLATNALLISTHAAAVVVGVFVQAKHPMIAQKIKADVAAAQSAVKKL